MFILLPVDELLDSCKFETITNKAAMNNCIYIFAWIYTSFSLDSSHLEKLTCSGLIICAILYMLYFN